MYNNRITLKERILPEIKIYNRTYSRGGLIIYTDKDELKSNTTEQTIVKIYKYDGYMPHTARDFKVRLACFQHYPAKIGLFALGTNR